MSDRSEEGFTLVELLVVMFLLSLTSVAFYRVMFSSVRGSQTTQDVVRVSEEGRLGFNRMVRDAREASRLNNPTPTSYEVQTDFNADGVIEATPSSVSGSYETLRYSFVAAPGGNGTINVTSGSNVEVLTRGVDCLRRSDGSCRDVFRYTSSRLEYEKALTACGVTTAVDGVTSTVELDQSTVGNNNCALDAAELSFIDGIEYGLSVKVGDSTSTFYTTAQLRNRR